MDEVKPAVWRCVWNTAEGECEWSQYHDAFDPLPSVWDEAPDEVHAYYDQQAIDTLRAEVERLTKANIGYAEQNALLQARTERAEAEAEALRVQLSNLMSRVVDAHTGDNEDGCGMSDAEIAAIDAAKQGAE